ncbi:hypothetical protein Tco_0880548 [Tanacetum coccineum]
MGWVVCSDAVVECYDAVLVFVVTAARCICDAFSSHYREILEQCWCRLKQKDCLEIRRFGLRCIGVIAWEIVENPKPTKLPHNPPIDLRKCTPARSLPDEVQETVGLPIEVEPLDETPLEDLGLNTCNHDTPLSSREIPSFDESEPQPQPFPSFPSLEVGLGEERDSEQPIKPLVQIVLR